jgi:hypothetical protein
LRKRLKQTTEQQKQNKYIPDTLISTVNCGYGSSAHCGQKTLICS